MKEILDKTEELAEKIDKAFEWLKIKDKEKEIQALEKQMSQPDFWSDQEKATSISKRAAELKEKVAQWKSLQSELQEVLVLAQESQKEKESSMEAMLSSKLAKLQERYGKMELDLMLGGKYDRHDAIVAIHSGAGGTDAQDWAKMIERMYLRYAENKNFKVNIIDRQVGTEAGIKSMVMEISGPLAYGRMKSEAGVHRLVRISPFDAEKMRHTSFAMVEVLPELEEVGEIELKDEEIEISTAKSSGPGGQGVNTTDSAVRVKHKPTGLMASCQNERSQLQNKETALKILKSKLKQYNEAREEEERKKLRGEFSEAAWGNQIRSYVLQPYKMVKDHRSEYETVEVDKVLDGELDEIVESYLKSMK